MGRYIFLDRYARGKIIWPQTGGLPNNNFGPVFNDWVKGISGTGATTGPGGDYPTGDVWMPGGVYRVDPFGDLRSASPYPRAFDNTKPYNNWLRIREFDGPGTVTFDLRPESAAAALGQTTAQAYLDLTHGGGFQFGTVDHPEYGTASMRWCFDGNQNLNNGGVFINNTDRLIFHGTNRTFPMLEWRRQFNNVCAALNISNPGSQIPDSAPYNNTVWFATNFKGNNFTTGYRIQPGTRIYILRNDLLHLGDDGTFMGNGSSILKIVGNRYGYILNNEGGYQGPFADVHFHNDCNQMTGALDQLLSCDNTFEGHALEFVAENGNITNSIIDRCWQGVAGAAGGDIGTQGWTMGLTNFIGSGAPTTRVTGHFYKVFSNGMDHNDGDPQNGYALAGSGANWHTGLNGVGSPPTANISVAVAVPAGVTVDGNGFITSGIPSFLGSSVVPHAVFRAAYAQSELLAVMSDYGIAFD